MLSGFFHITLPGSAYVLDPNPRLVASCTDYTELFHVARHCKTAIQKNAETLWEEHGDLNGGDLGILALHS